MSAVVTTYNRRDRLIRVLGPLMQDRTLREIVVVIDGCQDGSLELVEELAIEDSRLLPLFVENRGANAARIAGAEAASSEVVLLLDDDVIPDTGLAEAHRAHHESAAGLVVAGYLQIVERPWRPGSSIRKHYATAYERGCVAWERDARNVLLQLWAGNLSFRRSDLVHIKNTPLIRGYHADRDLGLHSLKLGLSGVFDRSLTAHHDYQRSLRQFVIDATDSGRSAAAVAIVHADQLGELDRARYWRGLPFLAAVVVRACRHRRMAMIVLPALEILFSLAVMLRWQRLEQNTTRVLARAAAQHGAADLKRTLAQQPIARGSRAPRTHPAAALRGWRDRYRWLIGVGATPRSALWFPVRRRIPGAGANRVDFSSGASLTSAPDESLLTMINEIWSQRSYLPARLASGSAATVVDIGANVGVFVVWAACELGAKRIVAVEPAPSSIRALRANITRNEVAAVTVLEAAVARTSTRATLYRRGPASMNTLYADHVSEGLAHPAASVRVITLDDVFAEAGIDGCDLLKLDCEGAEYDILLGAGEGTLAKIGHIVGEYHVGLNEYGPETLATLLEDRGFEVTVSPPMDAEGGHFHASRVT